MTTAQWIVPDWPVPSGVEALSSTRIGGVSQGPYAGFNLGKHVNDDPERVAQNRRQLRQEAGLPAEPVWLNQVHSADAMRLTSGSQSGFTADAAWTDEPGVVCAVLTADCLPVLLSARDGSAVAAVHAGWRGLAGGVIAATVKAMPTPAGQLQAWLGPAIGPRAFEVGPEVREAFCQYLPGAEEAFSAHRDRYLADLYQLARLELARLGVTSVFGGTACTYSEPERFYSYRRDGQTGRMVSLIWRQLASGQS